MVAPDGSAHTLALSGAADLQHALDALTEMNRHYLASHPGTPPLFAAGVEYLREPFGEEDWLTIPHVIQAGGGDCEDLASWLAAENPGARAVPVRMPASVGGAWHVVTRLPDGRIIDPSARLGMEYGPL